jgi:hypothetical protein
MKTNKIYFVFIVSSFQRLLLSLVRYQREGKIAYPFGVISPLRNIPLIKRNLMSLEFKIDYVVIPIAVYACDNLNPTAKLLFPIISMLDHSEKGCYAKNESLANLMGISEPSIKRALRSLIENKFVISEGPSNEKRILKIHKNARSLLTLLPDHKRSSNNKVLTFKDPKGSNRSFPWEKNKLNFVRPTKKPTTIKSRLITYWNRKEWCQTHKSPSSNLYKNISTMFKQLKAGTFGKHRLFDPEWLKQYPNLVNKKWNDEDLKKAMDKVSLLHKHGYWPEDKKGLPKGLETLIYNPRSKKSLLLSSYQKPPGLLSEAAQLPAEYDSKQTNKLIGILYGGDGITDLKLSNKDLAKTIRATNEIVEYQNWIDVKVCEDQPFLKRHFRSNDTALLDHYISYLTEEKYRTKEIEPYMLGPLSPANNWNGFLKYLADILLPEGDVGQYKLFKRINGN